MTSSTLGTYALSDADPLFGEMWDLFVALISLQATLALEAKHQSAERVITMLMKAIGVSGAAMQQTVSQGGHLALETSIVHFTDRLLVSEETCGDSLLISRSMELLHRISLPNQSTPSNLTFEMVAAAHEPSTLPRYTVEGSPPKQYLTNIWGYVVASAYEKNADAFKLRHGTNHRIWPVALQFFRHIRNGIFHGGMFDINQKSIIPTTPPQWRHYTMHSERAMKGRRVFEFMMVHHIPLFMYDMSQEIARL